MTVGNAFRAKTFSFAAAAKTGIQSLRVSVAGQSVDYTSDAANSITAIFVDNLSATLSIVTSDMAGVNGLVPGDTGAVVVNFEKRAEGRGAAGSGTPIVATFSNGVIESIDFDGSTTGVGSATVNIKCSAPAGGSPVVWS